MTKRTLLALLALAGCSGTSYGTVDLALSGEQAAVEGWPFTADGEIIAFADGWTIEIDRALVSITEVHLRARDGDDAALAIDPIVADLHGGDVDAWRDAGIAARRWDEVGYTLAPPSTGARAIAASEADVARMIAEGISLLVEGTASHATLGSVALSIAFTGSIAASSCRAGDGTDGLVVPASGTARGQLTFHLDHIFPDSLTSEAAMRFTPWAAAAGGDGVVTLDDLSSQRLADLRGTDGEPLRDESGALLFYDPGSAPLADETLRAFVEASLATLPHWNGEGHCDYARID